MRSIKYNKFVLKVKIVRSFRINLYMVSEGSLNYGSFNMLKLVFIYNQFVVEVKIVRVLV